MIPFDEAISIATRDMPDITTERTSGLYDRKANEKKKVAKPVGPISTVIEKSPVVDMTKTEYSDDEKKAVKLQLDSYRKILDDMKHARDTYKLMPDANPENLKKLEAAVVNARKQFREYEVVKNKVWNIINQ
jgi:hypothetical protein